MVLVLVSFEIEMLVSKVMYAFDGAYLHWKDKLFLVYYKLIWEQVIHQTHKSGCRCSRGCKCDFPVIPRKKPPRQQPLSFITLSNRESKPATYTFIGIAAKKNDCRINKWRVVWNSNELGQNITHFHIIMLGNSWWRIAMRGTKQPSYDKSWIKRLPPETDADYAKRSTTIINFDTPPPTKP